VYEYDIKFLNWDDFNPKLRNAKAEPSWCRLDSDIFIHPALKALSPHKQLLFMYLLTRVTRRSGVGQVLSIDIHHAVKLKHRDVMDALTFWKNKGIIDFNFTEIKLQTSDRQDRQTDKTDRQTMQLETVTALHESGTEEPSPTGSTSPKASHIDYKYFLNLWNSNSGVLPKLDGLSDKRKQKLKARLSDNPDPAYWEKCIVRMANSRLCVEGGWATFDWLFKNDDNHRKVTEGNYDNKTPINLNDRRPKPTENPELLARLQKIADEG